ncbi:MAG: hypothetical protein R3Y49_07220 [Rikenellaceae bacterium]
MKKLLLIVMLFATFGFSNAQQSGKYRLLIDYFTESSTHRDKLSTAVRNQIIGGVNTTNRLIVIDVDTEKKLYIEEDRRNDISALGDNTARMGEMQKLGANFIMNGNVDNVIVESKRTDEGKHYYEAKITFTIKVTEVANGTLFTSDTYVARGGGSIVDSGKTREGALNAAISSVGSRMRAYIDNNFPIKAQIVELKSEKKGKLQSCYVSLGSVHGISAGQYIKVSRVTTIAGRRSEIEIGQMKVVAVVAEDLSECKVTKGGAEILSIFNGGVDELTLQTINKTTFLDAVLQ